MSEQTTTQLRRYMGRRLEDKALRWYWKNEEEPDHVRVHKKAPAVPTAIGSVWEFTMTGDGSFYTRGEHAPVMKQPADSEDAQVIEWATLDRAALVTQAHDRKAAKNVRDAGFEAILSPIRKVYWAATSKTERAAVLSAVIQEITTIEA